MKKTVAEIQESVLRALHQIVPEVDLKTIDQDVSLRDQLDIDSMDFFRFMVKLHHELNIDVPEVDYNKLSTLKKCIEYINTKINNTK